MAEEKINDAEIFEELARALESNGFASSPRISKMLSYVVTEELAGRGEKIKAFSIALDVLDRDNNFDPQTDPVVRVNFGRIRNILELYYSDIGKDKPIRIEIPKGSYRPIFKYISKERPSPFKHNPKLTGISYATITSTFALVIISLVFWYSFNNTKNRHPNS